MHLVVVVDQAQDVVQIDFLRAEQIHLKHHTVPVHLERRLLLLITLSLDPLADVVIDTRAVLHFARGEHHSGLHLLEFFIRDAVGLLKLRQSLGIACGNRLVQLTQLHKLIEVLQHIFQTEILPEEVSKGALVLLLHQICGVGKLLLQLLHHFHIALVVVSALIVIALEEILVATFEHGGHRVFRLVLAKETEGLFRGIFQIAEADDVAKRLRAVVDAIGA